jgi:polyisoprenyl-phosphate glycosyltransferase
LKSVINSPSISVVVPVHGCADCISQLCVRIADSVRPISDHYEIIMVYDCSPDDSWEKIIESQKLDSSIIGIKLSRNYGQHIAITAGLRHARGDFVVVMDCDLQDPPELIPKMYRELMKGYDYILGKRTQKNHPLFRIYAAKLYFFLLNKATKNSIDSRFGAFSLLSRKVVDSFNQFTEGERHYLFILRWLGFRMGSVDYVLEERASGKSSYSLNDLFAHALNGLFFQATIFFKGTMLAGILFAISGLIFSTFLIIEYFRHGAAEGWTSITTIVLVSAGFILISVGAIGFYIEKIFTQIKQRPLYIVDKVLRKASKW